ncbi:MAG: sigma 54-interacting transcriptional regulator [Candidatus Zixiibacteriota bacterium]
MDSSSPKLSIDNRLLAAEELIRQRNYREVVRDLRALTESDFQDRDHELGLFLALRADTRRYEGSYRLALEDGLRAAKLLAHFPFNERYGRVQLVLSGAYAGVGDMKNAELRGRDALAFFRRGNDIAGQADALNFLARVAYIRCNYVDAVGFLEDAAKLVGESAEQTAVLNANIGRLRTHTYHWDQAEQELSQALAYFTEHGNEIAAAGLHLTLGYLQLRRRRFILAQRWFDQALEIISRLELKREKVIYLEYAGELSLEKGDNFKAKSILSSAYEKGLLLAPESSLVSQSARLLAEVELALDNVDEAMKYGQKALEISLKVGEKAEVGLSHRVIAESFAAKGDMEEAVEHINQAVEILEEVNDPLVTARTLLVQADIKTKARPGKVEKIRSIFDKARRLFRELGLDYWIAETDFRAGVFACQSGDLSSGFSQLSRAEKAFAALNEKTKVKSLNKFLKSLSDQAVALSLSQDNEFQIFGNLISSSELSSIKASRIEEILEVLLKRTGGDRAIVYSPDFDTSPVEATLPLSSHQMKKFQEGFESLLGEEISRSKPTLILDCRRDPFINDLVAGSVDNVASVVVVPFRMSDNSPSYLYVDKLSRDNGLNPFGQSELNFAVGFSNLIAFKWAEIQKNKLMEDNLRLKSQLREKAAFPNIITRNSEMLELLNQVQQVVNSNISISIEGETGCGKDLLVRAIHYNSERADRRFISVNCAALPETLLESELFGYKRGAFTGADRDKAGLFEEADGGTFFLDEIGDMPLNIQAKVLRVLEAKELVRLGETTPRQVDVRIVSATNKDLKELMSQGLFRQDLYYRLSALTFRLPSLRERRDDIPLLIDHFLGDSGKKISPDLLKLMFEYDWPGNIRELENEVKKLVLLAGNSGVITPEFLSGKVLSSGRAIRTEKAREVEKSDDIVFDSNYSLYDYLAYHEKRFIIKALREKRGVKKHAAELLNIPESTLRLKIKQYNIDLRNLDVSS